MNPSTPRANTGHRLQQGQRAAEEEALKNLAALRPGETRNPNWLKALGGQVQYYKGTKRIITSNHEVWARRFNQTETWKATSDDNAVLGELLSYNTKTNEPNYALKYLLAPGEKGHTILHTILDPSTYQDETNSGPIEFHLDRLKPLVRFLVRLQPELPATDSGSGPPIVMALRLGPATESHGKDAKSQTDAKFDAATKAEIVRFLCKKPDDKLDCLGSQAAIRSLGMMFTSFDDDNRPVKSARPVIHEAIESADFKIDEDVLKEVSKVKVEVLTPMSESKKESKPCLEVLDEKGRSCLHWVLTIPLDGTKIWWARKIAELQPLLLKTPCKTETNGKTEEVTPLQYMSVQKTLQRVQHKTSRESKDSGSQETELRALEDFLKLQCIREFDNDTCKNIMYTSKNAQSLFLTLEDQAVSWDSLNSLNSHYKLDTMLRSVHIYNNVTIRWDDTRAPMRKKASKWAGAGNIDLYMVFQWLKEQKGVEKPGVKKIIEVLVEDGAKPDGRAEDQEGHEQKPHSDEVIVECLKGLDVEVLDWRRLDIPADVIVDAAGASIKRLYLYCSGLRAVLQSWADQKGLARLRELERVQVEINQGLESLERIQAYGENFKTELELASKLARKSDPEERIRKKPPLLVKYKIVRRRKAVVTESSASKLKSENEQGFEEQDWLKCMDEFADIMELFEPGTPLPGSRPIRVALIDDGVKTSYAALDNNIQTGRSGWQRVGTNVDRDREKEKTKSTKRGYYRSYNSSETGHGTVMAYYLRRVCPNVKFYVAKLDPEPQKRKLDNVRERVTFTLESAAEAIEWAVQEEVDIISMSWAIDEEDVKPRGGDISTQTERETRLRTAIQLAAGKDILLFCANPDKGADYTRNKTYPWVLSQSSNSTKIFCIGAATQEKVSWGQISADDKSCDYFLPGVDLGIQVESMSKKNTEHPPKEWHKYSGSSLSCALAAGLAAMILHCALVSGGVAFNDPKWKWLRTARGMQNAFTRIQVEGTADLSSSSKWLPVRRLFGKVASKFVDSSSDARAGLIRDELVKKLLVGMLPMPSPTEAAAGSPPSPVSRRGTRLAQSTDEGDW